MHPLIAERARRGVLAAAVACAIVTAVLAAVVWRGTTNRFDTWVFVRAYTDFGGPYSTRREFWLWFSEPVISVLGPAAIAVWAWRRGRWDVIALAVSGPVVALLLTEVILKPLVGRVIGPQVLFGSLAGAQSGSFPSGHETGLVGFLTVAVLVLFHQVRSLPVRAAAVVVAVVWAAAGCVGLVVNYHHYATDTAGAATLTVAVVLGVALLIDRYGATVVARLRRRQLT